MKIPLIQGLEDLIDSYDGFILDIWGVVHQGGAAFPEAVDCLQQLRKRGKRVVFLSNAPRRAKTTANTLIKKGISSELYDGILCSGEASRIAFQSPTQKTPVSELGRRYYILASTGDDDLLDNLGLSKTKSLSTADFLLTVGLSEERPTIDAHQDILLEALKYKLTMVCINPDHVVIRLGNRELCAGALANQYLKLGGHVIHIGKPYPYIYALCSNILKVSSKNRVLAVGDGLATDIPGARLAGYDSLLITGGLLAEQLNIKRTESPNSDILERICKEANEKPSACMPTLRW